MIVATGNRHPRFARYDTHSKAAFGGAGAALCVRGLCAEHYGAWTLVDPPAIPASIALASSLNVTKFAFGAIPAIVLVTLFSDFGQSTDCRLGSAVFPHHKRCAKRPCRRPSGDVTCGYGRHKRRRSRHVQKPLRHRKLGGLMKNMLVRLGFLPVIVWLLLTLMPATSLAQQPPAEVPPEKAKQFLELLSDPEVKAWLEGSNCSPPALVRQD
jgi:hypothetical protein